MPPRADPVLSAARRLLPPDVCRAITLQSAKVFARQHAALLADAVLAAHRLASQKMVHNLRYVLAVQRCSSTPMFVALGVYMCERRAPAPSYLSVMPLRASPVAHRQLWTVVRTKRPTRYLAAMYRVSGVQGPRRAACDRSPKVALEPVRSTTAVLEGDTTDAARARLHSMTRSTLRAALLSDYVFQRRGGVL